MSNQKVAIKFLPFSSTVDSPFWVQYNHLKLETIRLSEEPIDVHATFGAGEARLQCIESSLDMEKEISNDRIAIPGKLVGLNTLEAFSKLDKNQFLLDHFDDTNLLQFVLLTFCDLKNHKVLYWFGIPALMNQSKLEAEVLLASPEDDSAEILDKIPSAFHQFRQEQLQANQQGLPPFFVVNRKTNQMLRLSKDCLKDTPEEDVIFGFVDSSTAKPNASAIIMGWPLRTMLAYLSIQLSLGGKTVTVVSYRPSRLRKIIVQNNDIAAAVAATALPESDASLLMKIQVPNDYHYTDAKNFKVVGWELNAKQKPGPRWVNLRPLLDSNHLAIQAADLNLKLMKWRMLPNLDVNMLQNTKCLLIGAGTLGCSVARTLLGWGIRHFTILDYGRVSYSNPVRQNLFTLKDCEGAGLPKAQAAVHALEQIAADVQAKAIQLSIPMPGHASETKESIEEAVTTLDKLVQEADVVYLLTDTRESRWLPTIMAAAHDKLLINAALGLDSWLVMRHGGGVVKDDDNNTALRLGCYFCNDIVAPENSTKNRTLDQQCTVTRPGLAPIAASMAVELMVSTLHHPLQQRAAAPRTATSYSPTVAADDNSSSALGVMPHQIRGSLVSYTMMTPTVPAFGCCTACAEPTIEAYLKDNIQLVYETCQCKDGSYLENLSGLTAFRAEAAEKLADMEDWDEDEDDEM